MAKIRTLVFGGAVGATLTYFFDPRMGAERRARLQDQLNAAVERGRRELDQRTRQLQRRALSAVSDLTQAAVPVVEGDLTVLSRVESVLYAMPGFPMSAVEAEVVDGRVMLRGEVESAEQASDIVRTALQVRNVTEVENLLRVRGAS